MFYFVLWKKQHFSLYFYRHKLIIAFIQCYCVSKLTHSSCMRHWISPCSFTICTPNISDISAFIFIDTNWLLLLYSVILFPSSLCSSCTRHWISDHSFTICAQNIRHKWYIYSAVWLLNRRVQFTASSARKHICTQTHKNKKFCLSVYPSVCYVYICEQSIYCLLLQCPRAQTRIWLFGHIHF